MKERKGFMLYLEDIDILDKLSDADFRAVIKALSSFAKDEVREPLSEAAEIAFSFMADKIGRDFKRYEERCSKNRSNVLKRYESQSSVETPTKSTDVGNPIQSNTNVHDCKKDLPKGVTVNVTVNETNDSSDGSTRAREETQPDHLSAVQYVSNYIIGMTAGNWEELQGLMEDGLSDELIKHGVDEAGAQSVYTWAYLRKVLNRYLTSGIKTVEQAKAEANSHNASSSSRANGKQRASSGGTGNVFANLLKGGGLGDR